MLLIAFTPHSVGWCYVGRNEYIPSASSHSILPHLAYFA